MNDHYDILAVLLTILIRASYILTAVLLVVENSRPSPANADRSRKLSGKLGILKNDSERIYLIKKSIVRCVSRKA